GRLLGIHRRDACRLRGARSSHEDLVHQEIWSRLTMKSLLGALQAGRLVELHSTEKEASLRALAHLIEAVPEMSREVDLVDEVLQRERAVNSGIGLGVACPHVRVGGHGEL